MVNEGRRRGVPVLLETTREVYNRHEVMRLSRDDVTVRARIAGAEVNLVNHP